MDIANWLRKRLNRALKFDLHEAVSDAQEAAHHDLSRLGDPSVVAEVARWEDAFDPVTNGISCERGPTEDKP